MSNQDAEHLQVMADAIRDVWHLALQWQRDDNTESQASDLFTAFAPLIAWEEERGIPLTVDQPQESASA